VAAMFNCNIGNLPMKYLGVVNTKNWYRKETGMWAEFGRRIPFGRSFFSKRSVEASAVGSTSSFGKKDFSTSESEKHSGMHDDVD
jgi:hypothetical protein